MKKCLCQKIICWIVAAPLFLATCYLGTNSAIAQLQMAVTQAACSGDGACPGAVVAVAPGNLELVKNQPYRAQATTETKQTLSDGSHTDQTSTASVARDSDGRTANIQTLSNGTTVAMIFDPVGGTHIDYSSRSKTAHVMPLPSSLPSGAIASAGGGSFSESDAEPASGAREGILVFGHAFSSPSGAGTKPVTESLGTKTIEGLEAVGTRSTSTIPAGSIGNDKNIVISRETWYSADLKLVLQSSIDDPRFGQTTYSLANIERSEPDASLFQVPAGYTIERVSIPTPPQ